MSCSCYANVHKVETGGSRVQCNPLLLYEFLFWNYDKTPWPKQLKEKEFILASISKGIRVHHAQKAWCGSTSKTLACHPDTGSRAWEQEVGWGDKLIKARPQWYTSSNKAPPPNSSTAFPQSTTNWGPNVQIHEPVGYVSHSCHHSCEVSWDLEKLCSLRPPLKGNMLTKELPPSTFLGFHEEPFPLDAYFLIYKMEIMLPSTLRVPVRIEAL